jgi:hypothetical protein
MHLPEGSPDALRYTSNGFTDQAYRTAIPEATPMLFTTFIFFGQKISFEETILQDMVLDKIRDISSTFDLFPNTKLVRKVQNTIKGSQFEHLLSEYDGTHTVPRWDCCRKHKSSGN